MTSSPGKVLITGVAGFLGSHLLDRFLADGHTVVGIDNLSMGSRANIVHELTNPRFHFLEKDVIEASTFAELGTDFTFGTH